MKKSYLIVADDNNRRVVKFKDYKDPHVYALFVKVEDMFGNAYWKESSIMDPEVGKLMEGTWPSPSYEDNGL